MNDSCEIFEESLCIARQVLPFMGSNGIPATPDNYIIFYFYHQGESDLVKNTVDAFLESGREWTEQTTKKMFAQLFGTEANLDLLQMNEKLANEIKTMAKDIIEETESTTARADQATRQMEVTLSETEEVDESPQAADWLKSSFNELKSVKSLYDSLSGSLKDRTLKLGEIVESLNQLEKAALTDELTQLANRRSWNCRLESEFNRHKRYDNGCSIILADIDDFKKINDTYGHLVGDHALREVARVIRDNIRGIDFAARFGGEEFTVLMPSTDLKGGAEAAERLRSALAATTFTVKGRSVPITASFGVARFGSEDDDPQQSLDRADKALYLAKEKGKNRVCSETQI